MESHKNKELSRLALLYIETKYPHIMEERFEIANRVANECESAGEIEFVADSIISTTQPTIKDSGERYVNSNGGQRDIDEGKFDPVYIPDNLIFIFARNMKYKNIYLNAKEIRTGSYENYECFDNILMKIIKECIYLLDTNRSLEDFAMFLEKASKKYEYNNFLKLTSEEDFYRFRRSLCRHAYKCLMGYTDEFHHEAIIFNAICLLNNFNKEDVIKYVCEPEKYALKGLTDGKKVNNG